jgi:hypothetical protein
MVRPRFVWEDFFTGTPIETNKHQQYTSRQNPSNSTVYVSNCLFYNCAASGVNGGALCCTTVNYLLVEYSFFFSCKASISQGGAIYFNNQNSGQCVFYGVCGFGCCCTYHSSSWGQFSWINTKDDAVSKNYVNYSLIANCINERADSSNTVNHGNGKIYCTSVNISRNKCNSRSVILCYPYSSSSTITCSMMYSSFSDNIAYDYICIWINRVSTKHEMKCCNVIRNTHSSSSYGLIHAYGNLIIEDSCFIENTATYIFCASSSYMITLSNCTVDKITNTGSLTIQKTVTKSFIHTISYIFCPTKEVIYLACKTNNFKAKISDFFSFNSLFMVTFIHSDH